jgi:hypothetical protein
MPHSCCNFYQGIKFQSFLLVSSHILLLLFLILSTAITLLCLNLLDKHAPLVSKTFRTQSPSSWFSPLLKKLNFLSVILISSDNLENFRSATDLYHAAIIIAKRAYNSSFISSSILTSKELTWIRKISVITTLYLISLSYQNSLKEWSNFVLLNFYLTTNFNKLQQVQNTLARVVLRQRKYEYITLAVEKLHWLPVQHRVTFKTASLVYSIKNTCLPS